MDPSPVPSSSVHLIDSLVGEWGAKCTHRHDPLSLPKNPKDAAKRKRNIFFQRHMRLSTPQGRMAKAKKKKKARLRELMHMSNFFLSVFHVRTTYIDIWCVWC